MLWDTVPPGVDGTVAVEISTPVDLGAEGEVTAVGCVSGTIPVSEPQAHRKSKAKPVAATCLINVTLSLLNQE